MLIAKKHKWILSRDVRFWTRIWSGQGDGLRAGTEMWDDGNTNSGDRSKARCPGHLLAFTKNNKF